MPSRSLSAVIFFSLLLVAGCGGNSKGSKKPKNQTPEFSSSASTSVEENTSGIFYQALATDPEGEEISYAILPDADGTLFSIAPDTGALSFNSPPDYETPGDQDGNNEYSITIVADAGNDDTATLPLTVSLTDVSDLEFRVTFPTPKANIGGLYQTHIAGVVIDHEDGEVLEGDVKNINVNGISADLMFGSPLRWNAEIPVNGYSVEITSTITYHDDTVEQDIREFANDAPLIDGTAIELDEANGRILVGGSTAHEVITEFDMTTKRGTMLYGNTSGGTRLIASSDLFLYEDGADIRMVGPNAMHGITLYKLSASGPQSSDYLGTSGTRFSSKDTIFNEAQNSAIVSYTSPSEIISVNLNTGDKTILLDSTTGTGDSPSYASKMAVDNVNNLLYVSDYNAIFSVNLATLERSIVSNPSTGSGPSLSNIVALSYDSDNEIIYVTEAHQIVTIDPASGDREILADATTGTGEPLVEARDAELSNDGTTLYILNSNGTQILTLNTTTGDRSLFIDGRLGGGVKLNSLQNGYLNSSGNALIATTGSDASLISIDLSSGDRTEISSSLVGSGEALAFPSFITPYDDNNALIYDSYKMSFYQIGIMSGQRTKLANNDVGFGDRFSLPAMIGYQPEHSNFYVADLSQKAIFSVDTTTGLRTIISSSSIGSGPTFSNIADIHYDAAADKLYVLDSSLKAILAVDTESGDRSIVSSSEVGSGAVMLQPRRISAGFNVNDLILHDYRAGLLSINKNSGDRQLMTVSPGGASSYLGTVTPAPSASVIPDAENNLVYLCGGTGFVVAVHPESGQKALIAY